MSEELKPCPFCGGKAQILKRAVKLQGDPWYGTKVERVVECDDCGCALFNQQFHEGFYDDDAAIAAWNRRTPSVTRGE